MARPRSFLHDGHEFVVDRGVFDPVRHLSGVAFAHQLHDVINECAPGARTALDLGTGCGLLAATLARLGLKVVATDVDQKAVACAAENCRGLDVDVRHGDMFAPVEGQVFDLVIVNPPYERADSGWFKSAAFTSADFLERFGARVPDFGPVTVVGFPADDQGTLAVTGLDLTLWRSVPTGGRDLGLFL